MSRRPSPSSTPSDDFQFVVFLIFFGCMIGLLAACGALA